MKTKIPLGAVVLIIVIHVNLSCKKEISCEGCRENNKPPIAMAGPDQVITLPADSVSLDGSASNDPDGTISEWLWKKIEGPASFAIANTTGNKTVVKNLAAGLYQFELKVTDNGGLTDTDTLRVLVDSLFLSNHPPLAQAGPDQVISWPANTVSLDGSGSTDPDNNITGYQWKKITGPASFTIVNANAVQTAVNNLVEGSYQFELKVTDAGGLFDQDTVDVIVSGTVSCNGTVQVACDGSTRQEVCARLVPLANLSVTRWEMAVASAGNKIVFAGGWLSGGGGASARVDIYDISSNTWTTAQLSQARASMATAVLGNKIFFAGGDNGLLNGNWSGTSDRVDIYDAAANSWTTATLSESRTFLAGAAAGNKVLFAGGTTNGLGSSGESRRVDIYDNTTNTWSVGNLPALEGPGIAATAIDNKIYFAGSAGNWFAWDFGGWYSSAINMYDVTNGNWSTASLSEEKGAMGAIAAGNKNYWAGGFNVHFGQSTHLPVQTVEVMTANSGPVTLGCLFQPNSGCAAVQKDSRIVFFTPHSTQNGWLPAGLVTNKFDIYDPGSNTWYIGVLPLNIHDASVISVNNTIYVAGGYVNGALSDQVWKLEF